MNKTILKFLNKTGILERFNFTTKISVDGTRVNIPIIGGLGSGNLNLSEPWMTELLKHILKFRMNEAYFDIGVNTGQTLIKVKSVHPDINYFGFEPNPICVFYAHKLVEVNKYKNVTLFPFGISNEEAIYRLSYFSDSATDSTASIIDNFRPNQKIHKTGYIPCFRFSKVIEKHKLPKIGVLKIDVEGAEKEVIEGLESAIIKDQPYIQVEILPVYSGSNTDRLKRQEFIEAFVRKINYTIFRIIICDNNTFRKLEEINEIGIHSDMRLCEYLLVPASEKNTIRQIDSSTKS